MKKIALIVVAASALWAVQASADDYVNGYLRSNGTLVQGHHRSSANNTTLDNYSSRGNTNPYTGSRGYRDPYQHYQAPRVQSNVPDYTGQRRAIQQQNRYHW